MARTETRVEHELARLATPAKGVVTRAELLSNGVTVAQIKHRLRSGTLHREYPGVYRVGHRAPSTEARYLAAVRACGRGALLCDRAAGHLIGILKTGPPLPEVVAPTARCVSGIRTRRARRMDVIDAWTWCGVPVTSVPQTIVDLAPLLTFDDLARACHEAGVRYGTTPREVEAVLARFPRRPGADKLRAILRGEAHVTLSTLERRFLAVLRDAALELPRTNRSVEGRRVDCRWPARRLTVELDGYRYHQSRHAWEMDRRREREARARGDEFRRYTYGDVLEDPSLMLAELRALLTGPS
jgi:very-short-patch-repair endonuclease